MRQLRVVLQNSASDDLAFIARFIVSNGASVRTARAYAARIRQRCLKIADAPFGGRPRDELESGLRSVPFENTAIILYKVEENHVRIINIFYGGRDYEALYRDEGTPGG